MPALAVVFAVPFAAALFLVIDIYKPTSLYIISRIHDYQMLDLTFNKHCEALCLHRQWFLLPVRIVYHPHSPWVFSRPRAFEKLNRKQLFFPPGLLILCPCTCVHCVQTYVFVSPYNSNNKQLTIAFPRPPLDVHAHICNEHFYSCSEYPPNIFSLTII